jgi:guanosine-3',5'-bis(diphosphate) 3'-pyrophosphohydrolase
MNKKENKFEILLKAISFAARAHRNQLRKDKETPYASHPFRVCMILRNVFMVEDEEILAAAVLHDTIEDTTTDRDDLIKEFGDKIAEYVALLSKDKRMEEAVREAAYIKQLKGAPLPVKLIKLADVYDNLTDSGNIPSKDRPGTVKKAIWYVRVLKTSDPSLAKPFGEINRLIRQLGRK